MLTASSSSRPHSAMQPASLHARHPVTDEERGKRDDDFKPKIERRLSSATSNWLPWRWRRRRIALAVLAVFLVYEFVTSIPRDLGSIDERLGRPRRGQLPPGQSASVAPIQARPRVAETTDTAYREPTGAPLREEGTIDQEAEQHYYTGKIHFYRLAESLHAVDREPGVKASNRNILFVASSLKSAANLLPLACEMAGMDRNYVHFVLFGRNALTMSEVLSINAIDAGTCTVFFHDARPDYTEYSTDARAEHAVLGAFKYINENIQPRAVLMDDGLNEDPFFPRAIHQTAKTYFYPLIEIPSRKYEEFIWLTRLDSASLASWSNPTVDIIVRSPNDNIGSLVRLLRSLQKADFTGLRMPRIIIELPAHMQPPLRHFLDDFHWPPISLADPMAVRPNLLTLHHRLSTERMTSQQASLRFVESYFPSRANDAHLLLLSPQAEVSPLFFQYLHYNLLEYRYSSWGAAVSQGMLGIALDIPATTIAGTDELSRPLAANMNNKPDDTDGDATVQFLFQAPSAAGSLIFADRWSQFHDFLARRTQASHAGKAIKTIKHTAESEPAWLEFLLELARARGWSMLHPASHFATVHSELKEIPEEFLRSAARSPPSDTLSPPAGAGAAAEEPYLLATAPPPLPNALANEPSANTNLAPLHQLLPFNGCLPSVSDLPLLSHKGELMTSADAMQRKEDFILFFRTTIGGCTAEEAQQPRAIGDGTAGDLFCLEGWQEGLVS